MISEFVKQPVSTCNVKHGEEEEEEIEIDDTSAASDADGVALFALNIVRVMFGYVNVFALESSLLPLTSSAVCANLNVSSSWRKLFQDHYSDSNSQDSVVLSTMKNTHTQKDTQKHTQKHTKPHCLSKQRDN